MEAAGLKAATTRAPRKSKGSNGGTPSSNASANAVHLPSPYQTPTSQGGPGPYGQYMYDPQQQYGAYPAHVLPPPGVNLAQAQSANSSRVPSPVNGHSSSHSSVGSIPTHHQQAYFAQQYSPAYPYGGHIQQQPYRYGAPAGMPSPYGGGPHPHHPLYSPGMAPDHAQQHMYSPMQAGFPTHSRENSYGVITPGYGGGNPLTNGYPPRTQTTTPLSQNHDDMRLAAGGDERAYGRRPPSPRHRTPPQDMLAQGVVDPSHMTSGRAPMQQSMQPPYGYQAHPMAYAYGGAPPHQSMGAPGRDHAIGLRTSISSSSEDGSVNGGSDGSGPQGESVRESGSTPD